MKIFDKIAKKIYKEELGESPLKYTDYYSDLAHIILKEFEIHRISLRMFDSKLSEASIKYLDDITGLDNEATRQKQIELADITLGIYLNSTDITDAKNEFLQLVLIIIEIFKKNKLFVKSICVYSSPKKTDLDYKYEIKIDSINKREYTPEDLQKKITLLDL